MLTYTYKEYEMPFCGGIALVTLYVEIHPREEWKDPLEYASGQDIIERGGRGILMRDIVTGEDHYCPFDLLAQKFPQLNIYDCGFSGGSGIIAKEGYRFDPQQYYEWKKRENLIPPGQ